MFTHSVKYTAGTRTIGSNLVSIVDREDGQVFILPIFFMTSALVGKLECQVLNSHRKNGAYRRANKTCHIDNLS